MQGLHSFLYSPLSWDGKEFWVIPCMWDVELGRVRISLEFNEAPPWIFHEVSQEPNWWDGWFWLFFPWSFLVNVQASLCCHSVGLPNLPMIEFFIEGHNVCWQIPVLVGLEKARACPNWMWVPILKLSPGLDSLCCLGLGPWVSHLRTQIPDHYFKFGYGCEVL